VAPSAKTLPIGEVEQLAAVPYLDDMIGEHPRLGASASWCLTSATGSRDDRLPPGPMLGAAIQWRGDLQRHARHLHVGGAQDRRSASQPRF
jgi:hypothetical protein